MEMTDEMWALTVEGETDPYIWGTRRQLIEVQEANRQDGVTVHLTGPHPMRYETLPYWREEK